MELMDAVKGIKGIELLKDLVLLEPSESSQFGTISVAPRHFKDKNKNEIILSGTYNFFLAQMYKDRTDMDEFFYITFGHRGKQRNYRCRSFYDIEYNKIFASGNTIEKLISDLNNKLSNYELK